MTQNRLILAAFAVAVLILLLVNSLYVVDQRSQVVVLRLGSPVRVVNKPGSNQAGLHAKVPFVENLIRFDSRNQILEPPTGELTTSNQERMQVNAFLRYRIVDPLKFYQVARSQDGGELRLQGMMNAALREAIGSATTDEVISSRRADLMKQVRNDVARRVSASRFGVQIIDLRIKRADLPKANEQAVFRRMQSQRQQEAAQIRAEGSQRAQEVLGSASKEGETIRGEADAERARIFASSYGKDASFAAFTRSMRAYETSLASGDKTLVLSPDSEFFRYFKQGPGR